MGRFPANIAKSELSKHLVFHKIPKVFFANFANSGLVYFKIVSLGVFLSKNLIY